MNRQLADIAKLAVYLLLFALAGTLLLAAINEMTRARIADNERQALLQQLNVLIAPGRYNNDLLQDTRQLEQTPIGSSEPVTVYLARQNNVPVAAAYVLSSSAGYNGTIRLAVGINADQTLTGVRVISHRETPGLGDRIEPEKNDWILQFSGLSLHNPQDSGWAVKKDGGQFDQFTGATITPRAIVSSVYALLQWAREHQAGLFSPPAAEAQPPAQSSLARDTN